MNVEQRSEEFEYWLFDMDDAVERFCMKLPSEVRERLDFTPESLDVIEGWVLQRYASVK